MGWFRYIFKNTFYFWKYISVVNFISDLNFYWRYNFFFLYGIKQTVNMVAVISCVTYISLYEDFKLVFIFIDMYLLCNYYVNRLFIRDMTSSTSVWSMEYE